MAFVPKAPTAKGSPDLFIGDVWIDTLAAPEPPSRVRVAMVRFAPGARNAWHAHANGQTLHVVEGVGFVQVRDHEVEVIRAGDTVWSPPGEWHWHGATPEHYMAHLAIMESLAPGQDGPDAEWGEFADYPGTH